jgi:hypothetical protein
MNKFGVWGIAFYTMEYENILHSYILHYRRLKICKLLFQKISASRTCENMWVKPVLKYIFEMAMYCIFLVPPLVIRTILSYVSNCYCVLVLNFFISFL